MTLTSSVVRPYVGSGKTDSQIHEELAALTVSGIPVADLENFLDFEGLAKRNPITGAWEGTLIDVLQAQAGQPLGDGLAELFSHINKPRSVEVATQEVEWAVKAEDLLAGLQSAGVITQEQHDGFYALGGGHKYPGIVVQDVTDAFTLMDAEDAASAQAEADAAAQEAKIEVMNQFAVRFDEKYNQYIAPAIDGGASISDPELLDGLQDLVDNWNV